LNSALCCFLFTPTSHVLWTGQPLAYPAVQKSGAAALLMRPHNWARYSFGPWLNSASERLHRNKLAVALANKLARIAWSVLRNDKAFDTHLEVAAI